MANAPFLAEPYYGADAYVTKNGLMGAQVTTFDEPNFSSSRKRCIRADENEAPIRGLVLVGRGRPQKQAGLTRRKSCDSDSQSAG